MNGPPQFLALTISPPSCLLNAIYLHSELIYYIKRYLNKVSTHWIVYPEFDKNSRLHYHGVLRLDDPIKWHRSVRTLLEKTIGFICIKPLLKPIDHIAWITYCRKEWPLTKKVLRINRPVIYSNLKLHKRKDLKSGNKRLTIIDYFKQ